MPICLLRYSWNIAQSGHLYKAVTSNLWLLHERGQVWSAPCLSCNALNRMTWITTSVTLCPPMTSNFIRLICRSETTSHNCRLRGSQALSARGVKQCILQMVVRHASEGHVLLFSFAVLVLLKIFKVSLSRQ